MARPLSLLSSWPLGLLHPLGAALGWAAYLGSPSYRRRLKAQKATPDHNGG